MSAPNPTANADPVRNQGQEVKREIIELVKMVALFLILFMILKTFVIEGYEVQGPSMYPTLEDGERILVLKLPLKLSHAPLLRRLHPIQPGDIVVFESKDGSRKRYIKRVIAMGPRQAGNTVSATAREDAANNVLVQFNLGEIYVNHRRVDEKDYLVPEEAESPDFDEEVLESGEYYVLGDHRSLSKDSRSFGPVTEDQIIGTALLRFWPLSRFSLF